MSAPTLEAEALAAVARGLAVWPLFDPERPDAPAKAPQCLGPLGPSQVASAARPPGRLQVARWFRRFRRANLGLVNGPLSGVVGIDVDPRHAPDPEIVALLEAGTPVRVLSGRGTGGKHYYFAWDEGLDRFAALFREMSMRVRVGGAKGIDLPWNLVLPPSRHPEPEAGDGRYAYEGAPLAAPGYEGAPPALAGRLREVVLRALEAAMLERALLADGARERVEGAARALDDVDWARRMLEDGIDDGEREEACRSFVPALVRGLNLDATLALMRRLNGAGVFRPPQDARKLDADVVGLWNFAKRRQVERVDVTATDGWPSLPPTWEPRRPAFPTAQLFEGLPAIRRLVEVGARSLDGIPEAYLATTFMSAASAMVQGQTFVRLHASWAREPTPLWFCTLGPPSSGKSRGLMLIRPALVRAEEKRVRAFGDRHAEAAVDLIEVERDLAELRKAEDLDREEVKNLLIQRHQLRADEVADPTQLHGAGTMEGLRNHLLGTARANVRLGRGDFAQVFWVTAEGKGVFVSAAGGTRNSTGMTDQEILLKGHLGEDVDVRLVKATFRIPAAYVTVCCLPQPGVMRGIRVGRFGAGADMEEGGLLARFAHVWPEEPAEDGGDFPPALPEEDLIALGDRLVALSEAPSRTLSITPDGWLEFRRWKREMRERTRGGDLVELESWARRTLGLAARVCAVLHLLGPRARESSIDAADVRRALVFLREYLVPHAITCWDLYGSSESISTARRVWRLLGRQAEFSRAEVTYGRMGLRKSDADAALSQGVALGFWRREERPAARGGTRPREVWITNPAARRRDFGA